MALTSRKPRLRKPPISKRQQLDKDKLQADTAAAKSTRVGKVAAVVKRPMRGARTVAGQEFYLPMPSNKLGEFLNRRRSIVPRYFVNSWRELKQVTWPTRRETWRLSSAVIIFSLILGSITAVVDKGIESVIKDLILK
jgi:preprotein translocase subunit SecE